MSEDETYCHGWCSFQDHDGFAQDHETPNKMTTANESSTDESDRCVYHESLTDESDRCVCHESLNDENSRCFANSALSRLTMVLVGSLSQLKWRDSLKARRWSKQRQKLVIQSYSPPKFTDGYKIQVRVYATQYGEFLHGISTTSLIEVSYDTTRNQCVHMRNLDRTSERSNRQRLAYVDFGTSAATQKRQGVPPSHQISKSYGIVQNPTRCTHVSHHSCRIEIPIKLTIIFSYRLLSPHLHLSLIMKPSKITRESTVYGSAQVTLNSNSKYGSLPA